MYPSSRTHGNQEIWDTIQCSHSESWGWFTCSIKTTQLNLQTSKPPYTLYSLSMVNKPKSLIAKHIIHCTKHAVLMAQVVEAYQAKLKKPKTKRDGLRKVCLKFEQISIMETSALIWPAFSQGWTSVYLTLLLNFQLLLLLLFKMLSILPRSSSCQTWKATRENMVKGLWEELMIINNNSGCLLHKRCGRSGIDKIRSRTSRSKPTALGRYPRIEKHVMFTNQLTHMMNRCADISKIEICFRLENSRT